ncbi:uncharacterized protein BYT42DRAFT_550111 [Radiomyces spectabilis]|uniref:uncharacterized protein n=1 Tax=Radiomyces spectabilis TaxID=64574 RepID=UPI00221E73CB|nr:uncharacterized protein BYT42DRAFT_550111 [Radiomyces spectabilis]KAI8365214.1 hypothetical protein BYT42DRAFT_550111 [Radiomyces spectabilis]
MSNEQLGASDVPSNPTEHSLDPLYDQLLHIPFPDSAAAIDHCRELCAQFGFTVKQEASTQRNIYVYCSREGFPDSLRNPKSNPQRNRSSKRCDCRWRIVLNEMDGQWEFRKSLNPDADKHNHPLLNPNQIERSWPKEMVDLIHDLARQQLKTQEIRSQVKSQFSHIPWNERRFYNRLTEGRQIHKHREATNRAQQLTRMWAKVCMAAAGSDTLSQYVEDQLVHLIQTTCDMAQIDPETLQLPEFIDDALPATESSTIASNNTTPGTSTTDRQGNERSSQRQRTKSRDVGDPFTPLEAPSNHAFQPSLSAAGPYESETNSSSRAGKDANPKLGDARKKYSMVVIPKHSYFVKLHNHRPGQEALNSRTMRRTRSPSTTDEPIDNGKPTKRPLRKGKGKAKDSQGDPATPTEAGRSFQPPMHASLQPHPSGLPALSMSPSHTSAMQHASNASFVYQPYPNDAMALGPPLGYMHSSFQHPYHMPPPGTAFNPDMPFSFDPTSPTPMPTHHPSPHNHANEPTIHPALQSNPMIHPKPPTSPHHGSPSVNVMEMKRDQRSLYPMSSTTPMLHPAHKTASSQMYKDMSIMGSRAILPAGQEHHYAPPSASQPHPLFMQRPQQLSPSLSHPAATVMSVYRSDAAPGSPTAQDRQQAQPQPHGDPQDRPPHGSHPSDQSMHGPSQASVPPSSHQPHSTPPSEPGQRS